MKKIIVSILVFTTLAAQAQQKLSNQFVLKGQVNGFKDGLLNLYYNDINGKRVKDSAALKSGNFSFTGKINEPTQAYLVLKEDKRNENNSVSVFLEPSVMTGTLTFNDFRNAKFTGSKTQDEAAMLDKATKPIMQEMKPLDEAYTKASESYRKAQQDKADEKVLDSMKEHLAKMHDAFTPYQDKIKDIQLKFFASHPNSYVTANNLRYYTSSLSLDSLKMFYNAMSSKLQQSGPGKSLNKEIAQLTAGSPGALAKDFVATDINGNKLNLGDFKGKLVLVDFWASWCVPCRHSNPHLIKLYNEYHDKGLDIIGVSDDDNNPDAWKKAVAKDGIGIWHHVLRGLDWDKLNKGEVNENDISDKFGIHSLPTKVLIDKNGVIIGRYDKGTDEEQAAMDKKIAEALNG